MRGLLDRAFRTRTRGEWEEIFAGEDACVSPVLSLAEAAAHPDHIERGMFVAVGGLIWTLMYESQGTVAGCWLSHCVVDVFLMVIGYQLIMG